MPAMMQIFAEELRRAGESNPDIAALSADVKRSTGLGLFAEAFPDRYYEMGISEQNMIGAAAGMALEGKTAVTSSYACFSPGRTWEQIRNTVCGQNADVKIIGAHIGAGSGRDGATHQCFEDIALISCLPGITLYSPATEREVRLCTRAMFKRKGPAYLRLSARCCPETDKETDIDTISLMKEGADFAVIGTGSILAKALEAVSRFEKESGCTVAVYNAVRLAPLDAQGIKTKLKPYKALLGIEEHQLNAGFTSMAAAVLAEEKSHPPFFRTGVRSTFGASMDCDNLYEHLGLSADAVLKQLRKMKQACDAG